MNEQHIEEMINTLYDYIQDAKALPLAVRFVTSTYQTELEEEQSNDVL